MNDEQKRAFLAVVLSGLILFGWQYFFAPKGLNKNSPLGSSTVEKNVATDNQNINSSQNTSTQGKEEVTGNVNQQEIKVKQITFKEKFSFTFNNKLELVDAKSITERFSFNSILGSDLPFEIQFFDGKDYRTLLFEFLDSSNSNQLSAINKDLGVNFQAEIQENGKLHYKIIAKNPLKVRFVLKSTPKDMPGRPSRQFLVLSDKVDKVKVGNDDKNEVMGKWFGLDFNYHLFAITLDEKTSISYSAQENGFLLVDLNKDVKEVSGNLLYTMKNYDDLVLLGENLNLSVDFGILGVIAVPILKFLQFLYKYIPNYGFAIILLTFLMKLITFPLQHKSYKSMKKMQLIQPELTKLKEKFKDDPQRMQKESMDLFKRTGANPLSGCLPLLLQTPIFFAFYRVLNDAVELVGAPFFGWINDLSIKDPYYILPIIMTIVMFVQQKLTPNTSADPTQRKVMMAMPLIFGLIMKDLPSGLTLYILISTICGIAQQLLVYKFS